MYCTTCGTPNPDHAVFCSRCGKRMAAVVATPQAPPIVSPPPVAQPIPPAPPPEAVSLPSAQLPVQSPRQAAQQDEDWIDAGPSVVTPAQQTPIAQIPSAQMPATPQFAAPQIPQSPIMQPQVAPPAYVPPPIAQPPAAQLPMAQFPGAQPPAFQQYAVQPPIIQAQPFQPPAAPIMSPSPEASWIDPSAGAPIQPPIQSPPMAQPVYAQNVSAQPSPPQSLPYAQLPNAQASPMQGARGAYLSGELKGIGGWLMFLVLCLTIFDPVAAFFMVIFLLASASEVANSHPEIVTFATLFSLLILAYSIWGVVVGIRVWKVRRGAVIGAKKYWLWGGVPFSIIIGFLPVVMLPPAEQINQPVLAAFVRSAIIAGFILIWYFYLTKSRRVAATFPQG